MSLAVAVLLYWPHVAAAEFVSTPVTTAYVGEPYTYDVAATGTGYVEITAPAGLPPWLSLVQTGSGTAVLSGTPGPGDVGQGILLRSEDTACRVFLLFCYRYQSFDITIIQNRPPVVTAPLPDQSAVEAAPFTLDVATAFADPDGDALTFTAAGLPPSLALSGGILSGAPTNADALGSPFDVTITADDGKGGRVSDNFALTVTALERARVSVESLAATPAPAVRGASVDWTITVANAGPSPSGVVDVSLELRGAPFTFAQHSCTGSSAESPQRVDCQVGPIPAGESATLTLSGTAPESGDVYGRAAIASSGTPLDPTPDDNVRYASVNVAEEVAAEAAQALPTPATAAAGGDLNGDGFADVAASTESGDPTAVHLSLENPDSLHATLTKPGDLRRGLSTAALSLDDVGAGNDVAIADFDNDGDLDLVVANGPGTASRVYANNGDGSMTALAALGAESLDSRAVAAADFDGDGWMDIALANAGASMLFRNAGGTGFETITLPGGTSRTSVGIAAANWVGDELPDIVLANENGPAVLLANAGAGRFGAPVTIDTGATTSVAAADFNGDARTDVVFGRAVPDATGVPSDPVYLGDGAGGFAVGPVLGATPTLDVATGDLTGDGVADVVAINATGAHQVFVGDGNARFSLHPRVFVSAGAVRAAVVRVSRSQHEDVVVAGGGRLAVFFNDGRGGLGLGDTSAPVIQLLGAAEMKIEVDDAFSDPGATATDDVDGALTPAVHNPVDPKVIGDYTVTYTAIDNAGNAAVPVTRTVSVAARQASGGGGGGAAGGVLVCLLLAACAVRHGRCRAPFVLVASLGYAARARRLARLPAVRPTTRTKRPSRLRRVQHDG